MINSFYKPLPDTCSLSEFLRDYEDLYPLLEEAIDHKLQVKEGGINCALKIKSYENKLMIISLFPECVFPLKINQAIPDNNYNWAGDYKLIKQTNESLVIEYLVPYVNKTIKISIPIQIAIFEVYNKREIKYPEEYFQGKYSLLPEIIQSQFNIISENKCMGHNGGYANQKAYWISTVKKAA